MTDIEVSSNNKSVIIETPQPMAPPDAPPMKIGFVEISQVVQRGSIWYTGSGPPTSVSGLPGDLYLDVDTGDIYRWDGDSWEYQGTFAPSTLTAEEILALLITVDGVGSMLDADTLDGHDSSYFATDAALDANTDHDAVQDTKLTDHDNAISQNAGNIGQNTSDIAAIQAKNVSQDGAIALKADKTYVDSQDALKVSKAGDTMSGPLTVVTPPTAPAHAASKAYVDAQAGAAATPPATANPLMDGTVAVGTATKYAREDHRHPSDTTKLSDAPSDGLTYGRKNATWATVIGGATTDDAPPPAPLVDGQLWFRSTTATLYVYYQDVDSSAWIQTSASPQMVDQNYTRKTALPTSLAVNGSMIVSQENGNTTVNVTGSYPADNWTIHFVGITAAATRVGSTDTRIGPFYISHQPSVKASLAATDYAALFTRIEGTNLSSLAWGTSVAVPIVVAFSANASVAGTYALSIRNGVTDRSYVIPLPLTTSVQRFVFAIPGDTTGTWANDATLGMVITICGAAGSTFQTATTGQWVAGSFIGFTGMSNLAAAANQSIAVGKFGLYADPGSTGLAPAYEVPDYASELYKCKRYWQQVTTYWAGNTTTGGTYYVTYKYSAPPRGAPTLSGVSVVANGFPAAVGTLGDTPPYDACYEGRVSNLTGNAGVFRSNITVNARM